MVRLGARYPTAEHEAAAMRIVEHFAAGPHVDAVILMGSCARGKADVGSCLDVLVLVQPDVLSVRREELQGRWNDFCARQEDFHRLRRHGKFAHVDFEFVDGRFQPRPREWTSGPDEFELEIGNTLVYAVPPWTGTDYFERLRAEWLPYYGEALRSERLAIVRRYCLNNLEHIPLYVDRGLYFQALNPDFSPGVVANRRRAPWIRGLRRRTPQAYPGRYVEDGRGSVTKQTRPYPPVQQILGERSGLTDCTTRSGSSCRLSSSPGARIRLPMTSGSESRLKRYSAYRSSTGNSQACSQSRTSSAVRSPTRAMRWRASLTNTFRTDAGSPGCPRGCRSW